MRDFVMNICQMMLSLHIKIKQSTLSSTSFPMQKSLANTEHSFPYTVLLQTDSSKSNHMCSTSGGENVGYFKLKTDFEHGSNPVWLCNFLVSLHTDSRYLGTQTTMMVNS